MADEQATATQEDAQGTAQTSGAATQEDAAEAVDWAEYRRIKNKNTRLLARVKELEAGQQQAAADATTHAQTAEATELARLKRERERAEAEREQAQTQLRQERISRLAEREAATAHAVYPDLVAFLLERDLEFEDGDDKPSNLNTLLGSFRRKYPLLFRAPTGDGGAVGTAPGQQQDMNALLRRVAGRA